MSSISIIGTGQFGGILAARALNGGNSVEIISRDPARAADRAGELGHGATTGKAGGTPTGDIVILALPPARAVSIVSQYGNALAGKILIDVTNPFNSTATGLITPDDSSMAQEIAKAAPASARVIKAFNTIFGNVLANGRPLDALFAGDDARAKASVSAFVASMGLRPLDVGDLAMARWLEGAALLMMGLGQNGIGNYGFALGVSDPS